MPDNSKGSKISWLRVVIGLAIVSTILFGMHYYLWVRLVHDTAMPTPWREIMSGAVVLLGVTMLGGFPLMRFAPRWLTSAVMWVAYTWMGLAFLTIVLLAIGDLVEFGARFARGPRHSDVLGEWFLSGDVGLPRRLLILFGHQTDSKIPH